MSIGGSMVECSPATRAIRVRFPADATMFFASRLKCLGDLIESRLRCLGDVIAKVFDSMSNEVMDMIKVIRSDVRSDLLHYGIFNKKPKEDVYRRFI